MNKLPFTERGLLDLVISLLPDIKLTEKITLLNKFESLDHLFVQSKRDIEIILNRQLIRFWDITEIRDRADRIDTICRMRFINWVSWNDVLYPPLLREIFDPPSVIFYRGKLPNPEKSLLGIVGTRNPSPEAAEQVYKIAGNLSRLGFSVVSGLALGIDAMAHRGNLVGSAPAYAVLGSGIDEVYPSSNKPLAKRILDSDGAIISEYPPGVKPAKWTFPARNRIIAGLSRSVVISEAPFKSGALITAAFALEQGRDLWVTSEGLSDSSKASRFDKRGTEKLVSDGAEIIYSASDVLEKWNITKEKTWADSPLCHRELISSMADFLKIDI
ncbi:MAG: DNA-processing protein DprA [Treponema sp.]|jgi:DNA processing protein|nr:DNA-processing protein DprA [Treponema sp.]